MTKTLKEKILFEEQKRVVRVIDEWAEHYGLKKKDYPNVSYKILMDKLYGEK